MKSIWLFSVRAYLRIGMFFYFKRIELHNIENIPKNKGVLFLANHQNALLDALLIATKCDRYAYFLTRASVFKKKFISLILRSLQMLPVYRLRDGWNTLSNNNAIFETCTELFYNNEIVVIFPEGSHNLARRVRPLSKGFTRIVFDTLEKYPNLDLQLVPIGLNFQDVIKFPDEVAIYFGEPIAAKDFILENKNESVVNLKAKIQSEISKLTTNIPMENYDDHLRTLKGLNVDFLNPQKVNDCISNNFKGCKINHKTRWTKWLQFYFKLLMIASLILPYVIWKLMIFPKIEEPEFISTFRFAVAVTLVPVYLLLLVFVIGLLVSFKIALTFLFVVFVLVLLTVKL